MDHSRRICCDRGERHATSRQLICDQARIGHRTGEKVPFRNNNVSPWRTAASEMIQNDREAGPAVAKS